MKDGITRYACPKCGCSADSFISIGDSEATSSISAPSAWRQNRGTGDNISNQPTKGNKVICPDCGKIFDEEPIPSSCPNCGCPSSAFTEREIADINKDTDFSSEEKIYYHDNTVKITNSDTFLNLFRTVYHPPQFYSPYSSGLLHRQQWPVTLSQILFSRPYVLHFVCLKLT